MEKEKKREEEEKLRRAKWCEEQTVKNTQHNMEVNHVDCSYVEQNNTEKDSNDTSPLLLDEIIPLSERSCSCSNTCMSDLCVAQCKEELKGARRARDNALLLARQYRDRAEKGGKTKTKKGARRQSRTSANILA